MTKPSRIRLWDKHFHCLYDSETDLRTPEQFMADEALDEANYSKDHGSGGWVTRDSGRLIRSHDTERLIWSSSKEWLRHMTAANNTFFDDPGRFGADIPPIREGSRVGFEKDGKVITGTVRRVYEDDQGLTHIEFDDTALQCCAGGPQWGHAWDCKGCPD